MRYVIGWLFLALLLKSALLARKLDEDPQWVKDYTIINPFPSCGPDDNCVELPDIPPVWRFIPEYMGWRKFTPIGAIRKDWNDFWRGRKRFWWDYTWNLPPWRFYYNGWNLYNNSFNQW